MQIEIDYAEALKNHPEAVAEATDSLRKSKSKYKDADVSQMTWFVEWCQMGRAINGTDMLRALTTKNPEDAREALGMNEKRSTDYDTFEEYFETMKGNVFASIVVSPSATGMMYRSETLKELPEEIVSAYKETWQEEKKEQERYDALSPEEQQEEINDLLAQLSGSSGFMAVGIPALQEEDD